MSGESEMESSNLERAIAGLRARRIEVSGIIQWAKSIIDVPDVTFEAAMRAWQEEVSAERYGDFGAILLQSLADACPETKRKQRLQKAAQELAQIRTARAPLPATEKPAPTDVTARIERATQLARAGRHEDALLELEPAFHDAGVRRAVAMLPPRFHTTAQSTGLYRDVAPVPASATVRWVADGIAVDTNTIFLTDFAASPVALLGRCGRQKRMVVLDPDTGALRCEWPYADAILHRDEPALLGDVALILSNPEAGKPELKARDVGTGELLWSWRPEGSVMLEGLVAGLLIELQEKSIHVRPYSDPRVAPGESHQGWSQDRDWFKPVKTTGKDAGVLYAQHGVTEDAVVQYIADDNRGQVLVRALHPQLGSELWRTRIDPEGRNWIGGENQWEHWVDGVTANLVTDRSGLVLGVKDGEWQDGAHVFAFAATGELRWRAWDVGARPIALAAEGVYVTTTRAYPSRTLMLLDRASGARRWEHSLALDSGTFLAVRGAFYSLVPPSTLEVRSATDAALIQSVALPLTLNVRDSDFYCEVSLAAANGRVFVAAGNKVVCVGEKSERRSHVSYDVPYDAVDETPAAIPQESIRVERKDCPTCTALDRADAEGKLDIYVDDGQAGPAFPPEVEALEAFGVYSDRDRELMRCRDCGTLYRCWHRHEYDAYAPGHEEYHVVRVEEAVAAVVAPLWEPLATDALDAALARALRHETAGVRKAVVLVLQSAPEKGGDAALRALAEGLADAEYEIKMACFDALIAAFKGRGAAQARAVLSVVADLGENSYNVKFLRSACQEEIDAPAMEPPTLALTEARETPPAKVPAAEPRPAPPRPTDVAPAPPAASIAEHRMPEMQLKPGEGVPSNDLLRIATSMPIKAESPLYRDIPARQKALGIMLNDFDQDTSSLEDRELHRRLALGAFIAEHAADPGILESEERKQRSRS